MSENPPSITLHWFSGILIRKIDVASLIEAPKRWTAGASQGHQHHCSHCSNCSTSPLKDWGEGTALGSPSEIEDGPDCTDALLQQKRRIERALAGSALWFKCVTCHQQVRDRNNDIEPFHSSTQLFTSCFFPICLQRCLLLFWNLSDPSSSVSGWTISEWR